MEKLEDKILKSAGLDKLQQVSLEEAQTKQFLGFANLYAFYQGEFIRPDHYLLRGDDYVEARSFNSAKVRPNVPEGSVYFLVQTKQRSEHISPPSVTDMYPIVFFKDRRRRKK